MQSLILRIVVLWGWRRHLLAVIAGALSVLALPPYYFFPVLFITFPILVWLLDGVVSDRGNWRNALTGAMVGWSFGFGYFFAGLYWLGEAFLVEADIFAWMIPFVLVLLPAGLAFFPALACGLARIFWTSGFSRILIFSVSWAGFEWIRGHIFTGLPWNNIGYAFSGFDGLFQILSITGIYGLSLLVVLIAASPAVQTGDGAGDLSGFGFWQWRGLMIAAGLLASLWGWGHYRLSATTTFENGIRIRIVQPNIKQKEKWKPENRSKILAQLIELSNMATSPQTPGIDNVTHLIWPESAMPVLIEQAPNVRASLAAFLPDNTFLITGALRKVNNPLGPMTSRLSFHNSVMAINGKGAIIARYDKFHLVPFGEYVPFERLLSVLGIGKLVTMPAGFIPGKGKRLLQIGNQKPILPLVCYEAIFARYASVKPRPGWMLNVTNDAWFGESSGPWQHFEQARARAVEQGLTLVRAANTGISAIIDPYGRIVKRLALNQRGVIDSNLPKSLNPTIYAQYGNFVFLAMLLLSTIMGFLIWWSNKA